MRVMVIAVYIGPLPGYLAHWLRSCAANSHIDWLLVTDHEVPEPTPANVLIRHETLASLARLFSNHVGFDVALTTPYKLNDLKPLFFLLLPEQERYEYWGFCDLDVVWGDLKKIDPLLGRYDMILSEGHLRFIRNSGVTNDLFRSVATPRDWRDILTDPQNFGMDEHSGINRAWAASGRAWRADPAMIADIDTEFRQFRRIPQFRNYATQAFAYEHGRVVREYYHFGRYGRDEFLYMHFPKRKTPNTIPDDLDSFFVGPDGFLPRHVGQSDAATLRRVNRWRWPNHQEVMRVARHHVRPLRGQGVQFPRVDTLAGPMS